MSEEIVNKPTEISVNPIKAKKTVSFSQFTNWWICPHKWMRDYILKEKTFEDNLIMSFGTAVHETIQNYLTILYKEGDAPAAAIDNVSFFKTALDEQIKKKSLIHTIAEYDEFIEDGKNILSEFIHPKNRRRYFPRDKWELVGIEHELKIDIRNNVNIVGFLDLVLKDKTTGHIRIVDFKTSRMGWTNSQKEDFTKTSQLVLYKALYSKKYNIPLSSINVEFVILRRKLYDSAAYEQSRIGIFKPSSYQKDVLQVIQEFGKFVDTCFTTEGVHNTSIKYPKNPGKNKKNCKYCNYLKNGKCDGRAEPLE